MRDEADRFTENDMKAVGLKPIKVDYMSGEEGKPLTLAWLAHRPQLHHVVSQLSQSAGQMLGVRFTCEHHEGGDDTQCSLERPEVWDIADGCERGAVRGRA